MQPADAGQVNLANYTVGSYHPGRGVLVQALWFFLGQRLVSATWHPFSGLRCGVLRLFGAKIGLGVVIKPGVKVKYPWRLSVGEHAWIGEEAWIDNLAEVAVGAHACISQGAYLCTGNHDWSDPTFSLLTKAIRLGDGSWVGARGVVCPGVQLGRGAIAAAGSVVTHNIPDWEIHAGNPAAFRSPRRIATLGTLATE